ncbi:acetyl-CoA hydrolase/transferase family protein [Clostridium fermenticellae]|uniref:Acetyl-CoA hydrolase/transferase family protein n=1 Tax=Clostridium fermenticellae TaxID=2068654 RepID=A0A386H6G1_9CLOT|nr:acetyl-CoA hydrolase/transferase C-terminal domain-containing protein [Clostridium fermenticellae]AYD41105.1 acetyl-CoA hydrolase/transferase family protein [Clostridium fermenticellae]
MNWKEIYKSKLVSAEEAVSKIKSNDRVVLSHAVGEPSVLIDAMVKNKDNYENVEIVHMVAMGKGEYTNEGMEKHFIHNSLFVGASTRKAVNSARADYTPCFFYEVPRLFKEGYMPVDVALVQLSRPDAHGFCSFGVSNDYSKPAADCAKLIIAEVNENMPRTMGDSFIHVSDIDYIVETSHPIIELKPPKIGDVEKSIGRYCASLIEDGSTLQLGIGAIPDAVLLFLKDKKDLGIHSEMISDGVVDLVDAGVITNKKKTLHPGKIVVTFLMGTKKLYDFVNDNPMVEAYPVSYVNDPTVIMKNYKMVSINSCVQVDLMGQICSESIGLKQISGVGGQIDFIRGASMAKDGKSIIAIPSTAAKGKVSRIVPLLDEGAAVTTSRNDVDYVITEYGIARLKGKTLKQRACELINIAHPDFREELIKEYEIRFNCKFL